MIDAYLWNTPNGKKPAILLEELGVDYTLVPVNIGAGEQFAPDYVAINPNSKIPALVHHTPSGPVRVFESGAILVYLAQTFGTYYPGNPAAQSQVLEWLFWQVGGVGPMMGQYRHFTRAKTPIPYAIERYHTESLRLMQVLENQLANQPYVVGSEYTIADIALWPWIDDARNTLTPSKNTPWPAIDQWCEAIGQREAVQRALVKLKEATSAS